MAIGEVEKRLRKVLKAMDMGDPTEFYIEEISEDDVTYKMPNESFGLGGIITDYLQNEKNLIAAYTTGRPMSPTLEIRLKTLNNQVVFKEALETLIGRFMELQNEWTKVTTKKKK